MSVPNVEERIKEIVSMSEDDESCFEGFGAVSASDRRKAAAFRQLRRQVRLDMLAAAGLLKYVYAVRKRESP